MLCTFCNKIHPTEYVSIHYYTNHHIEQVCTKEFEICATKYLSMGPEGDILSIG